MVTQFFLTLNLSSVCLQELPPTDALTCSYSLLQNILPGLLPQPRPCVCSLRQTAASLRFTPAAPPPEATPLPSRLWPIQSRQRPCPHPPQSPADPPLGIRRNLSDAQGPVGSSQGLKDYLTESSNCPAMPLTWRSSRWGEQLPGRTGTGTDRVRSGVPRWRWPAGRRDSWTARGRRSGTRTTKCTGPGTRRSTRTRSERAASSLRGQGVHVWKTWRGGNPAQLSLRHCWGWWGMPPMLVVKFITLSWWYQN